MSLVDRIIARAKKTPYFHLAGYMERYWLLKPNNIRIAEGLAPRWLLGDWGIRVHRILRSDADDCFHDHPWASISVVLRGGYLEWMPFRPDQDCAKDGFWRVAKWRKPGAVVIRKAKSRHKLELMPDQEDCWSLFIMRGRVQSWGFYPYSGYVPYKQYLGIPEDTEKPPAGESQLKPRKN